MSRLFTFWATVFFAIAISLLPSATYAATKSELKVKYISSYSYCFTPETRGYAQITKAMEFNTLKECNDYIVSLNKTETKSELPKTVRYFDGVCYTSADKAYNELSIFKDYNSIDDCSKAKSSFITMIADSIQAIDNCSTQSFVNYSQKTFDCTFDITDSSAFRLNPSLKIRAKVDVAREVPLADTCEVKDKNADSKVLVCKNIPIGTHEKNVNLNSKYMFKFPFSSDFFRFSPISIVVGDDNTYTKSGVYIADNTFQFTFGGFIIT